MTSIQSVCLRIPTSLKATNTWARYLASNFLEIVKTAIFRLYKKMFLPPNVEKRERVCLPKETSSKRASKKKNYNNALSVLGKTDIASWNLVSGSF